MTAPRATRARARTGSPPVCKRLPNMTDLLDGPCRRTFGGQRAQSGAKYFEFKINGAPGPADGGLGPTRTQPKEIPSINRHPVRESASILQGPADTSRALRDRKAFRFHHMSTHHLPDR